MSPASLFRLLSLSAIWGGSFLLIRIGAPALGVLCSGIAYLLYFRLIEDIGAAPALTVTFLIPLFGSFFDWLILDEAIGWHTLAGGAVVIAGTALVTGFSPRLLAPCREAANA